MKTAMTRHIEWLKSRMVVTPQIEKELLEQERIQIIDASATAYEDMFGANGNEYGENYYNKKFNN
jgi:hypothetical protein